MKTIVYHYQQEFTTGIHKLVQIGTVIGDNITPDLVWELTNWTCWVNYAEYNKIKNNTDLPIHCDDCTYNRTSSDIGYTNHDIMFELDGVWYTAESFGFAKFNTYDEAKQHLIKTNP